MRFNIALAGPLGSGKSAVSQYLDYHYGLSTWSFGDYVREAVASIGISRSLLFASSKTTAVRELLQGVGHGARMVDQNIWLDKLLEDYFEYDLESLVIDDMRYENEADAMRRLDFKLVYVECPGLLEDGNDARNHESEHGLDDWYEWDGLLTAEYGDVKALFSQMDELIARWECET